MSDEESTAGPGGAATPSAGRPSVNAFPLLPTDPPRIGRWWLDARLVARPSGVAFLAHADGQASTMLILLSRGAAGDAAARDRLAGEINRMSEETVIARGGQGQDQGRLAHLFVSQADDPVGPGHAATAPWTVLAWDDSDNALREADRLLRSVDLSGSPELGTPSGPAFSLPWIGHSTPGNWRLWPQLARPQGPYGVGAHVGQLVAHDPRRDIGTAHCRPHLPEPRPVVAEAAVRPVRAAPRARAAPQAVRVRAPSPQVARPVVPEVVRVPRPRRADRAHPRRPRR